MSVAMGVASVFSACLATAAFCAVLLHLGLDQVQQRREHFWLAIAALGIVQLAIGNALVYEAQTLEQAREAQVLSLMCTGPLVVGLLRFTALMTRSRIWPLEVGCAGLAVLISVTVFLRPDLYLSGPIQEREVAWLGLRFVEMKLTPWAALSFIPFLLNYVIIGTAFLRRRDRFEQSWPILASFSLWTACAFSDALASHGIYDAPYLFAFGYLAFLGSFSVLLVRQFTASLDRLEVGNEELGLIVEERTAALHRKELQVAHGARMATVGTLSAGLAREIREPLGEVARRIDAVAEDFGNAPDPASIETRVDEARRGIERIRSIVSELLHVARREGGTMGPVDLNRVVQAVLPIVRHEARHRARLEIQLAEVPQIEADEQLVSQILLHLVLNGIQAVPPGPPERGSVTISTERDGEMVRLRVHDTGPGIPEEIRAHVFEPFFTTKPGEATGLGLAVAHQLVERHRGRIAMETGEHGTTMIVDLPIRQGEGLGHQGERLGRQGDGSIRQHDRSMPEADGSVPQGDGSGTRT